jgi:hypothetical protein
MLALNAGQMRAVENDWLTKVPDRLRPLIEDVC